MDPDSVASLMIDRLGETGAIVAAGALLGMLYGAAAQRSRFCLRASVVEFADGRLGPRFGLWLLTFSTALFWTQALAAAGWIDLGESRWLSVPGSLSGAILGGLLFGAGMVLARGCPGRLLVLGASGNLRAILSGLVFAVVAQMSLRGQFAPVRAALAEGWTTAGPNPDLTLVMALPEWSGLAAGSLAAVCALAVARRNRISARTLVFGSAGGFAVALGWLATSALARTSFDPVTVESLSFSGPSADALMFVMLRGEALDFDTGLVPGVALGAFLAAWTGGALKWEGWSGAQSMQRYLVGAALMGFGAMLAGGCAIGAGVTGSSALALSAWVALTAMWVGGAATHRAIDAPARAPEASRDVEPARTTA